MPHATDEPRDWWKAAVVYQVYPRTFVDGDGDGMGDIPGIRQQLDHLERLGVDVVWLSPVYRSPMDDNGYDISDYRDVDPLFGTLADLDGLIADLHQRGMKLVMDLVVNHTSSAHAWFEESRSSTASPKRDWYWWRPSVPNDWQSFFSGPAWTRDDVTGEYYLHLFAASQPDLNWENPEVREAVYEMMRWWLDRGVDGFRMDVINLISKPSLEAAQAEVFNGPRIHDYLQEMRREVFFGRPPGLLTIGETPGCTIADARLYTDPERHELDMVFQFEHVDLDSGPGGKWDVVPLSVRALKASLGRWQAGLADVGWNSLYFGNHDQPRCLSRFGDDSAEHRTASAKALATVLHLHRGTPFVYQGDELGMTNAALAGPEDLRDIESVNAYRDMLERGVTPADAMAAIRVKSRDHARTPVPWDGAIAQWEDPDSVLHHYRALIALRHDEPVVVRGDFTMLVPEHEQVYAFVRRLDDVELLVVANLSSRPAVADVDGERFELAPWETHVDRRPAHR